MTAADAVIPVFGFDIAVVKAMNGFLGVSPLFDKAIWIVSSNPIFKGFLFVSVLWLLGARESGERDGGLAFALRWIGGLALGLLLARLLQNFVPAHLRPISEPALALRAYREADNAYFARLYSFPSDHAVMFCALSTAIWSRSRSLGVVAFAWSIFLICLPRLYFGYHYPGDLIAGAALGVAVMAAALAAPVPRMLLSRARAFELRAPGVGQGLAFFVSAEIAVNFDHVREIVVGLGKAAGG